MAHLSSRNPAPLRRWPRDMSNRIFENKTADADKNGVTCRTDFTSTDARRYGKTPLPGERDNPKMEIQHVGDR